MITGLFTDSPSSIGGYVFDAVFEEGTELKSTISNFPMENGSVGTDNSAQNPLMIRLTVAVSDDETFGGLADNAIGVVTGGIIASLPTEVATLLSTAYDNVGSILGADTRSRDFLSALREVQKSGSFVDVVTAKGDYKNCLITNTQQTTTKENESGVEVVIELIQPLIVNLSDDNGFNKDTLPNNDPVKNQAQKPLIRGRVSLQ